MSWYAQVDRWFHGQVPRERLVLWRIALGLYACGYLVSRAPHLIRPVTYAPAAFSPVGVVSLVSEPLGPTWVIGLVIATTGLAVLFTVGARYRLVAPAFAALLLWVISYRHSWGMLFHTDNLFVLHVMLMSLAPAAGQLGVEAARAEPQASGWVLKVACWLTVASYFVAGLAKLSASGLEWMAGNVLREQIAYDAVRKIELGSVHSPLGPWLLPYTWLFGPLSVFSLAAEVLAPLALLGRRWATVWCASAWLFHLGVAGLMAIVFPYPLTGCAFLCFFPLERWRKVRSLDRLGGLLSRLLIGLRRRAE